MSLKIALSQLLSGTSLLSRITEVTVKSSVKPQNPIPPELDYDLAIAGGGIVGTTLASALKLSGLRVLLIESQSKAGAASKGQTYAISLLSGRIFAGIGVWEKIIAKIATFRQIRLSDADHSGVVQFYPPDLGTEELGYVGEHRALLTSLQEFLDQCAHVTWLCPAEVIQVDYQPDWVEIEVNVAGEIRKLRSKLLIAADGSRSPIREAAGITTQGWKYWQSCITTRIKPEKPHDYIAYERFWPSGPFAILPLPGNLCNIVWTSPHAEAKALMELDDQQFMAELNQKYGAQMGRLEMVGPRTLFQVQLMQCDRYVLPRLALIGDAAHCCHPVGGQGLNMGIRDAAAIAQVLQEAHQRGEDIGDLRVLKRYERWRKPENLVILGFTDFLDRLFSNHWFPLVLLRRFGLWILRNIRPIKLLALRLMTGLSGHSPKLAVIPKNCQSS